MNIVEIMQTTNDNGLTLTEMRAKVRMNIALRAFGLWQKKVIPKINKPEIKPEINLKTDFFNLFTN